MLVKNLAAQENYDFFFISLNLSYIILHFIVLQEHAILLLQLLSIKHVFFNKHKRNTNKNF